MLEFSERFDLLKYGSDGAPLHFLYEYARVIEKRVGEEYAEVVAETPESIKKRLAAYVVDEHAGEH